MEHLDIVLWVIGWPVSMSLTVYLNTLDREKKGINHPPLQNQETLDMFIFLMWIIVPFFL